MKKAISMVSLILCMVFVLSCSDDDSLNEATKQRNAIMNELKAYNEFNEFILCMKAMDISTHPATRFTVFAVKDREITPPQLVEIWNYYAASQMAVGSFDIEALKKLSSIEMLDGRTFEVKTVGDNVYINGMLVEPLESKGVNILYRVTEPFAKL
ncbi:hypothetical protein [Dysgonomonas macrotermitis]|uniref:FAS1 domain-containing protein n=1 Tax=Dysgonomonas macrotermitis TaxID=1346286 RepID=A0A1M5HJ53_9BACT|nr:hypothetical protein [Dysgonomonas macrotermitis]SHG15999.1 hypothetical protein SAMN05444362_11682 [Dysgonomonas macrotermitis]